MTQFVIDLLDSSNVPIGSGPLQNVLDVSITEKLDEAGEISFTVPATDTRAATLIDTAARFRVRFSSGAVHYGIIDKDTINVTADQPTRTVTGADILRELQHYSMGWWCFYDNQDLNTVVLPQLVADTGWSLGTIDAALGDLYYRFDGDSRLSALLKISQTTGKHFRIGSTVRTFDFGAFGSASSIRFTNVDHALKAQDTTTDIAIIGSLQITGDRGPIVNRIIPWGAGQDAGDTNRAKVSLFHLTPGDSRWANIRAKPGVRGVQNNILSISEITGHHYVMDSTAGYFASPVTQIMWCYDPSDLTLGYGYDFVIREVDPLGANTLTVRGSPTIPTEPVSFPAALISNPQLYIQDDTAYAADPHEAVVIFTDVTLTDLSLTAFENGASQLYNRAYNYLQTHKVQQTSYAVSVFNCPDSLRVGDTVQIVYRGVITRDGSVVKWVDLNDSFNVINITRSFSADGSTSATVEISNIVRQPIDSSTALSDSGIQVGAMGVTVGAPSVSSAGGGGGGSGGFGDPLTFAAPLVRTINNITLPLTTGYIFKGVTSTATASAPEALTKSDDTNVTLTLGGSASTALVNAASIAAGWQGQLSSQRGGTGIDNGGRTLTINTNSATLSFAAAKTLTVNNSLTLAGTDSSALTLTTSLTNQGAAGILNWGGAYTLNVSGNSTLNGSLVGNMTGGGTVATGGFTLTVPKNGTAVTGNGTANYISKFSGDANTVGNSLIRDDGTSIAIGIVPDSLQRFYIVDTETDSSTSAHAGIYAVLSAQPAVNSAGTYAALTFDAKHQTNVNLTSVAGGLRGVTGIVRNTGSGIVTQSGAVVAQTIISGGGSITGAFEFHALSPSVTGSTIGLKNGVRVENQGAAGITTSVGIHIAAQSGSGTAYSIFEAGVGLNVFGDQLALTGHADRQQLIVTGFTTQAVATSLVQFTRNDANTNAIATMLGLNINTTGTGAAGLGGAIALNLESSTTADTAAGLIKWLWNDATHASRKADLVLSAYDTAEREFLRGRGNGSAAAIGFLGATPIARYSDTGDLRQALIDFGLYTTGGASPLDLNGGAFSCANITTSTGVINSLIYGSMYADDITQAVTVAVSNTYYKVPGSMTVGLCNGFTLASNRELTCTVAGTYHVVWGMSITSANNNENISGAAMVNTTEVHQSEGSAQCINSTKPVHVSGSAMVTLAVNDVLALCVQNEDAAHDITVFHANLTAIRIGA